MRNRHRPGTKSLISGEIRLARKETIMQNALIRAVRTFFQTAIGVYLAGLVAAPTLIDLGDRALISSAAAAGVVAVLSFIQNALEESGAVSFGNRG